MTKPLRRHKGAKVSVHLSPEHREQLDVRLLDGRGPSATMAQAFTRYAYLCARTRHGLSDEDVEVFASLLADEVLETHHISMLAEVIQHRAADGDICLSESTVAKLEALSIAQRIVLADDIERNWR